MQKKYNNKSLKSDLIESLGDGTYITRNYDLEKSLLKTCLTAQEKVGLVTSILTPEHFADPRHKDIYSAIVNIYNSGNKPHAAVVAAECLRKPNDEIEPSDYHDALRFITESEGTDIESACKTLHGLFLARKLQAFSHDITTRASAGDDINNLISDWNKNLEGITAASNVDDNVADIDDIISSLPRGTKSIIEPDRSGIKTPWPGLNDLIYGLKGGELIVIGARPGVGKTVMLAQMAYYAAQLGNITLFYSHEMKRESMWRRLMCTECSISNVDVNTMELTSEELQRTQMWLEMEASRYLLISDKSGKSPMSVRSDIIRKKAKYGQVGLVVIDYLQLMYSGKGHMKRYDEVSDIIRSLKRIAVDENVPILVASAMNREYDKRIGKDKRPQLSDLNESGNIEADASIVIFPNRPSMVHTNPAITPPDDELIVEKNRDGRKGIVPVFYRGEYFRFDNPANA